MKYRLTPMPNPPKKPTNGPNPVSIPPEQKASIMVELAKIREQLEENAALAARAVRLAEELKPLVEALTDQVLEQKEQLKKLASSVAVNKGVDATQNREIADIKQQMTTKEKVQVGGVAGGTIGGIIAIIEILRGMGAGQWLVSLVKGTGG